MARLTPDVEVGSPATAPPPDPPPPQAANAASAIDMHAHRAIAWNFILYTTPGCIANPENERARITCGANHIL
jgi:hypothetical protein